jgi:hypothetical protein
MMTKVQFFCKFTEITVAADTSIRQTHGIMCYQDGNLENENMSNIYVLHILDVMNIHMRKKEGLSTTLFIPTHSLSFILDTTRNKFIKETLTPDMLIFFEDNVDFFTDYTVIMQTINFVPLRTKVLLKCKTFKLSRFFTNDPFFMRHQRGKLSEFNQMNKAFESTITCRSI